MKIEIECNPRQARVITKSLDILLESCKDGLVYDQSDGHLLELICGAFLNELVEKEKLNESN